MLTFLSQAVLTSMLFTTQLIYTQKLLPARPLQTGTRVVHGRGGFTSPDGAFRFDYSKFLLPCNGTKDEYGNFDWQPRSCDAYSPMCKNTIGDGEETIACFAYRRDLMKNYPEFEAATFSAAQLNGVVTENDCLSLPDSWIQFDEHPDLGTATIHGVDFKEFNVSEGGLSHYIDRQIYRNFHHHACYELTLRIAVGPGAIDLNPPMRPFAKKQRDFVHNELRRCLYSFQFLE
jgi:hypothetical protein